MARINENADASPYYTENATADVARMDSTIQYGNLGDAMKDATFLLQSIQILGITEQLGEFSLDGEGESEQN